MKIDAVSLEVGTITVRYTTEMIPDYVSAIRGAKSLSELRAAIEPFRPFAWDAAAVAEKMTEAEWPDYQRFDKVGREEGYSGADLPSLANRFGDILVPETLMKITQVASAFGAPWGLACNRLAQAGRLTETEDGRILVDLKPETP